MNHIKEFKEFVERYKPTKILFLSDNQDTFSIADPCEMNLVFTDVLVHEYPNIVYFSGGASFMRLDRVKSIEFIENSAGLGTIVKIRCKNQLVRSGESEYTVVMLQ